MDALLTQLIEARDAAWRAQHGPDGEHYLAVLQDRADRFAAHVATMTITPDLAAWALAMATTYGTPYVRMHYFVADWLTALLIARYGEEPDAARSSDPAFAGWPNAFTDADRQRAAEMLATPAKWPLGLSLPATD